MVNLFDIARQAESGHAFASLSRRFGLDGGQTQRAVEALLPAFTLAFQRTVMDPGAFANLIGMVGSGRFAPFYDAEGSGGGQRHLQAGESVLGQLFGSKEVTRQIASQASTMTGIGAQVFVDMLPILAASLVGGMFRFASVEGFADFLRQWSEAIKAAHPPRHRREAMDASDPWSAWGDVVRASFGGAQARPAPAADNPVEAWSRMMATMLPRAAPPPPPPSQPNPFEAVSRMFETGRDVQAQYLSSLQAILDGVWGTAPPRRSDPRADQREAGLRPSARARTRALFSTDLTRRRMEGSLANGCARAPSTSLRTKPMSLSALSSRSRSWVTWRRWIIARSRAMAPRDSWRTARPSAGSAKDEFAKLETGADMIGS